MSKNGNHVAKKRLSNGKLLQAAGLSVSDKRRRLFVSSLASSSDPNLSRSAELWEYNPSLNMWTEILVNGAVAPAARDGHTASVAGSKMIIFGGRGNASDSDTQGGLHTRTALLGDEWEIDLDLSQHVTAATNSSTVTIFALSVCSPCI